ncbi:MAG: PmoA family protein [Pirellulaceae bacterium]|nr:PmoA family protein [Pirellulaceae bacterium]
MKTRCLLLCLWLMALANLAPAQELKVEQTEQTLTVLRGDKAILVYNIQSPPAPAGIDKVYERSGFLHPVYSPKGQVLTAAFPIDHAHQHGIFSAWVNTKYRNQPADFWNLAGKSARVLHERVASTETLSDGSLRIELDLLHRVLSEPAVDVLRERWKITVLPSTEKYNCFDLETIQTAITDEPLVIEKYHYGGVAYRGSVRWLLKDDSDGRKLGGEIEPNRIVNALGQERIEGNHAHARWVSISGQLQGKPAGLVMMDHPRNFRSPQAARVHPTKPYFVYSPCVDGAFNIDKQHPYHARYRFIVHDQPLSNKQLDKLWQTWAAQ